MKIAPLYAATTLAAALLASACATPVAPASDADAGEARYVIVEENAEIFPPSNVNGFEVVDRDTLLLRVGASRLYLADVWRPCTWDLRYVEAIALDHGGSSTIDKFSHVYVNGQRCPIDNVRRVERRDMPAEAAPAETAPAEPAHQIEADQ